MFKRINYLYDCAIKFLLLNKLQGIICKCIGKYVILNYEMSNTDL